MNIQQTASTPKLVTMIPADPQMTERDIRNKHLRIAPYCRVSTDKKEQLLFRGAMKLEKPETASEAIDIAGQLHCYPAS